MGWPASGSWEGLNAEWLAPIAAAICTAVNQRQLFTSMGASAFDGSETIWTYCNTTRPTAEDFAGMLNHASSTRTLMSQIYNAINNIPIENEAGPGIYYVVDGDIWGGGSLDLTKNALYLPSWTLFKNAVEMMTVISARPFGDGPDPPQNYSDAKSYRAPFTDAAILWASRFENAGLGAGFTGGEVRYVSAPGFLAYCQSQEQLSETTTWESGKYLGKLINNPISVVSAEDYAGVGGIAVTPAVFEYKFNGVPFSGASLGEIDMSHIAAGEDVVYEVNTITTAEFSGTDIGPGSTSVTFRSYSHAANIAVRADWLFDMSTLLTDQT